MINKYVFIFLFFVLLFYFINTNENFTDVLSEEQDILPFDNFVLPNVPIPKIPLLKKGDRYELLDLPYCNEKFHATFKSNTNNIINDGSKIYQDMTKPYEQNAKIGDKSHGLTQISWQKSYFNYNEKPVGLELHFTHFNQTDNTITKVIFPLSFSPNEKFTDLNYPNETNSEVKKQTISPLEKLGGLNGLIGSPDDVPENNGKINVGKLLTFDICTPAMLILDQKKFFYAQTLKNELLLIAKPQNFSRTLGMKILNNLNDPDEDLFLPDQLTKLSLI